MSDYVQEEESEELSFLEKIKNLRRLWIVIGILIIISVILGVVLFRIFGQFSDFSVRSTIDLDGSAQSKYKEFSNGLLSYSRDGATYSDFNGEVIWSETYDMQSPCAVVNGEELLIYDKSGTRLTVMTNKGSQGEISTTLPIVRADIAKNGIVAVLMQDNNTGYLNVYEADGGLVASGQVHLEKTGYPIAIAISPDGKRLAVSLIGLNNGNNSAQIIFYDFGKTGSTAKDNVIASFNYIGTVFPEIRFFDDGRAVAYGESEIVIYSAAEKPDASNRIKVKSDIRSVMTGSETFGVITKGSDGHNDLTVYDSHGKRQFEKSISIPYNTCYIASNGDTMISNGEELVVFNTFGTRRFHYIFSDGYLAFFPEEGMRNYFLVEKGRASRIVLK
ncbi:MAG: DUF5711 family protein [Lachnospiraceae bacterium]|nr:DUF5711 family protein [Lachnospiraceae bacterium]